MLKINEQIVLSVLISNGGKKMGVKDIFSFSLIHYSRLISMSSLYVIISRLKKDGLISRVGEIKSDNSSKITQLFQITTKGKKVFADEEKMLSTIYNQPINNKEVMCS